MKRSIGLSALLWCLLLSVGLAWAAGPPPPKTSGGLAPDAARSLLKKSLVADENYWYSGTEVVTYRVDKDSNTEVRRVFHDPSGKDRWEYDRIGQRGDHIVIDDGVHRWTQDEKGAVTVKEDSGTAELAGLPLNRQLNILLGNYVVELLGNDNIAGRNAKIIALYPKRRPLPPHSSPATKIWIDTKTGVTLRNERFDLNGDVYSCQYFMDFSQAGPLSSSLFEPRLEKGIIETRYRPKILYSVSSVASKLKDPMKSAVILPEKLPLGFQFVSGWLVNKDAQTTLVLRYTDGLATISVFQSYPSVGLKSRISNVNGDKTFFQTSTDSVDFVMVGDIDSGSMLRIAENTLGTSYNIEADSFKSPGRVTSILKQLWVTIVVPRGLLK